jgi:hypothetical protein
VAVGSAFAGAAVVATTSDLAAATSGLAADGSTAFAAVGGTASDAPSAGAGVDSRRGLGGGTKRREEPPGGTESVRDGEAAGACASTVIASSRFEIDGELLRCGAGGRPLASAALEPGGGRLGVPTERTRWLGIFGGAG